jgi:uncharacterized membrane protein YdjX (TVP38/TMEM64 family)
MWQQGYRNNSADSMGVLARKLNEQEIAAVAAYYQHMQSPFEAAQLQAKQAVPRAHGCVRDHVEERRMNKRNLVFRLIVVAALLGAIVWLALHRESLQAAALERELGRFGPWAPSLFVTLYAFATVLFVPGSVLTVAGGALFGPVWGTLWNLTGATLGAKLAFMIARYVASDWVAARAGERLARLIRGVEEEGWRFVAFVRLVPLFPFNLVNYAFGLTRIRVGEYVLASFVCMAPGALAYTYLGYAGARRPPDRREQSERLCLPWRCLRPSLSCHDWCAG